MGLFINLRGPWESFLSLRVLILEKIFWYEVLLYHLPLPVEPLFFPAFRPFIPSNCQKWQYLFSSVTSFLPLHRFLFFFIWRFLCFCLLLCDSSLSAQELTALTRLHFSGGPQSMAMWPHGLQLQSRMIILELWAFQTWLIPWVTRYLPGG